jgi:diguanylate cyclase (GGDEF)-like protein
MMNARLEWNLLQQSILDPLTGALNRRGLEQGLERELARYRRYGDNLTVAMLDLDHFKRLNDTYGHAAGDAVLVEVVRLLSGLLRETDVVGRFGGEEFVLLLPHTGAREAGSILEDVCRVLGEHSTVLPGAAVCVTASVGATTTHGRLPVTAWELLHEADIALYRAKANGRNQVRLFSPNGERSSSFHVSSGLHHA